MIQSLNKFASANLVIAGEPPNVGQDYFPWIGRHSIGRVWGLGKFCRPEGGWPCSQAQGEGAAGEPWQGGLWLLGGSHCPPPQGQPFPERPPCASAFPVSSRQNGPINLFPSTPVPVSQFHQKYHQGSNPSGFRRLAAH